MSFRNNLIRVFVFSLLLVISLSIVYSSSNESDFSGGWYGSGDYFIIDNISYLVSVSNNLDIYLKDDLGNSFFYNIGDCEELLLDEFCFVKYRTIGDFQQIFIEINKREPSIIINSSIEYEEVFAGTENKLDIRISVIGDNPPDNLFFTAIIQNDLDIGDTNLDVEYTTNGTILSKYFDDLKSDEIIDLYITLNTNIVNKYSISGVAEYDFNGLKEKVYLNPISVNFKSHFKISDNFPEINESGVYDFELFMDNLVDDDLKFNSFDLIFPLNLNVVDVDNFVKNKQSFESELYNVFSNSFKLTINKSIEFSIKHFLSGNYEFFVLSNYSYLDDDFIYFKKYNYSSSINNSETHLYCSGDDFNISFLRTDLSYADLINNVSRLVDDMTLYPGVDINSRIYLTSLVDEDIGSLKFNLYENNSLILVKRIDFIQGLGVKSVDDFVKHIPFGGLTLEGELEYFCKDSNKIFTQNFTKSFTIEDINKITIDKKIDNSDLSSGEETKVTVKLKNDAGLYINDVYIKELIPNNFTTRGIIEKRTSLKKDDTDEVYTYYIKAPFVLNETSYITSTLVFFTYENKTFNYSSENVLKVTPKINSLDSKISAESNTRLYEPLLISGSIKNKNDFELNNVNVIIPKSSNYDIENKSLSLSVLYPNQTFDFEINLLPKNKNFSIENISFWLGDILINRTSLDFYLLPSRTSFSNMDFSLHKIVNETGDFNLTKYNVEIFNSGGKNFKGRFYFNRSYYDFDLNPDEIKSFNFSSIGDDISDEDLYSDSYIYYEFLKIPFIDSLDDLSTDVIKIKRKVINDSIEYIDNVSLDQKDEVNLSEGKKSGINSLMLLVIFYLVALFIIVIIIVLIIKHSRSKDSNSKTNDHNSDVDSSSLNIDLDSVNSLEIKESHILDIDSKESIDPKLFEINSSSKNVVPKLQKKSKSKIVDKPDEGLNSKIGSPSSHSGLNNGSDIIVEKEVSKFKESHIFSFDDYEKLKEDLEKDLDKESKDKSKSK